MNKQEALPKYVDKCESQANADFPFITDLMREELQRVPSYKIWN